MADHLWWGSDAWQSLKQGLAIVCNYLGLQTGALLRVKNLQAICGGSGAVWHGIHSSAGPRWADDG